MQSLRGERRQDIGIVAADEACRARGLLGEVREPLLGLRVAVDADELAAGAEPVGDEAGVAARAERAVDRGLARGGVERLDQLAGEDGDVQSWHVDYKCHGFTGVPEASRCADSPTVDSESCS